MPWITCTKPASLDPPPNMVSTSVQSMKVGSPSYAFAVSFHQLVCSALSLLVAAAFADSKRAMVIARPSGVTPVVEPRYPFTVGLISETQRSV